MTGPSPGAPLRYKLFAVDLDGTLLDREGRVHDDDLRALRALRASGVRLSIITGRMASGTRPTAAHVGIDGPIACIDGGHIVHASSGASLFHATMPTELAEPVRASLRRHRPATFVMAHDEIVHDDDGATYLPYVKTWSTQVVRHARATEHPHWGHERGVSQVVCVGHQAAIEAIKGEVEAALGEAVFAAAFPVGRPMMRPEGEATWAMVVRSAGASKGTAVRFLAEHHGIGPDEVVVVGDWLNDVPMFVEAGRSFAMGQAPEAVKRVASDVLEASMPPGGGVAEAARRAGLLP